MNYRRILANGVDDYLVESVKEEDANTINEHDSESAQLVETKTSTSDNEMTLSDNETLDSSENESSTNDTKSKKKDKPISSKDQGDGVIRIGRKVNQIIHIGKGGTIKKIELAGASKDVVKKRQKKVPQSIIMEKADSLIANMEKELEKARSSTEKVKGVRVMQRHLREMRDIRSMIEVVKLPKKVVPKASLEFSTPYPISQELRDLLGDLGKPKMARGEITKAIGIYVRARSLNSKEDGKIIIPDKAIRDLLELKEGETTTYTDMQRGLNRHMIKPPKKDKTTKSSKAADNSQAEVNDAESTESII
jgi:chromatin remodeling complex protein RSC6